MEVNSSTLVHRLLFHALTEIRDDALSSENKLSWHLAQLFHNAALQMESASEESDSVTYDDVLAHLKQQAEQQGCDAWLTERMAEIESRIHANSHVE